jgi:hypothetical protein
MWGRMSFRHFHQPLFAPPHCRYSPDLLSPEIVSFVGSHDQLPVAVFGVGGDIGAVIVGTPMALATWLTTDLLARLKLGRLEGAPARSAAPLIHVGVVAPALAGVEDANRFRNCCKKFIPRPRQGLFSRLQNRQTAVAINRR